MLEAMRLGITEWLPDPVGAADLDAALQRVTRPVSTSGIRGRSFAVVGGKGGVGCTTIAVNLAAAIRNATKEPTLLLDLHMAQGDTSVFLGVEPRFTVLDALENIHRLDDTYFHGLVTPTPAGVDLLASANRPVLGSIDVLRVQALFEFVTTAYPWVIIDCPRSDPGGARRPRRRVLGAGGRQPGTGHAAQRQPPGGAAAPAVRRAAGSSWPSTASTPTPKSAARTSSGCSAGPSPTRSRATTGRRWRAEQGRAGSQRQPWPAAGELRRSGARPGGPAGGDQGTRQDRLVRPVRSGGNRQEHL